MMSYKVFGACLIPKSGETLFCDCGEIFNSVDELVSGKDCPTCGHCVVCFN